MTLDEEALAMFKQVEDREIQLRFPPGFVLPPGASDLNQRLAIFLLGIYYGQQRKLGRRKAGPDIRWPPRRVAQLVADVEATMAEQKIKSASKACADLAKTAAYRGLSPRTLRRRYTSAKR
jgi:Uma2 family endonuclease